MDGLTVLWRPFTKARVVTASPKVYVVNGIVKPFQVTCNLPPAKLSMYILLALMPCVSTVDGDFMSDDQILTIEEAAQFLQIAHAPVSEEHTP